MKFDLPKEQASIIKVIGVGGGGSNAVNHMYNQGITGVDVVIQDSGIQAAHPEFQDAGGTTRVQLIDWFTDSGISGTQSASFYSDTD